MHLLRARDYQRTRWKNDGGWTTEIASRADEGRGEGFLWRVSIAEIETDGPFSVFPGVQRDLLMLAGNGMDLDINDQPPHRLAQRFQHIRFQGEDTINCRLLAGPTRDFNVMAQRDSVAAEVHARPINGTMLLFSDPASTWLIHTYAGQITARSGQDEMAAEANETLLVEAGTGHRERIVLEGGGELILVKFSVSDPVD